SGSTATQEPVESIEQMILKVGSTPEREKLLFTEQMSQKSSSIRQELSSLPNNQFQATAELIHESRISSKVSTLKDISSEQTQPEMLIQKINKISQITGATVEVNSIGDVIANQVSKVQQFSIFVEQSNTPLPNQQQFIRQFQNILARSSFLNNGGQQKLLINLYPEHLGSLRIELLQTESGMIARIMASTSQAKELLETQLANLRHTFIAQNISVDKIEVSTQLQYQTERNMQRENEHQQEQRQQSYRQQDEQSKQEHGGDETSFTSTLLNELVNFKV